MYCVSGKILFSLISLGPEYVYTTLSNPPVPVPFSALSSTTGLTKPNTGSVTVAFISLPLESVVADPICFF